MIVDRTPVEQVKVNGRTIYVKREDMCCPWPGPPFSKMRGVVAHVRSRPEPTIGVLDTLHSKAGWAVAYACQALGKKTVNYWPKYQGENGELRYPQQRSQALEAELIQLKAGRSAILYHQAKKDLLRYANSYMMPNALKLRESVMENAAEASRTFENLPEVGTLLISISSGTVASGVLRAFSIERPKYEAVLHMGYSRSEHAVRSYLHSMTGMFLRPLIPIRFVDEGYGYADKVDVDVPFPCNPYYDAKAWKWMTANLMSMREPIVFWNIGD